MNVRSHYGQGSSFVQLALGRSIVNGLNLLLKLSARITAWITSSSTGAISLSLAAGTLGGMVSEEEVK